MRYVIQLAAVILLNFKLASSDKKLITIAIYKQPDLNYTTIGTIVRKAIADFQKAKKDVDIDLLEIDSSEDEDVCSFSNVDIAIDFSNVLIATKTKTLMSLSMNDDKIKDNKCLRFYPPNETIVYVIRHIVDVLQLSTTAVIYDETFETLSTKYVTLLTNLPTRQIMIPIQSSTNFQLDKLRGLDINNIFVAASAINITNILISANESQMLGKSYAWYLLSKYDLDEQLLQTSLIPEFLHMKPSIEASLQYVISRDFEVQGLSKVDQLFVYKVARYGLKEIYKSKHSSLMSNITDVDEEIVCANFTLYKNSLYDDVNVDLTIINNTRPPAKETKAGMWNKFRTSTVTTLNNATWTLLLPIKHYRIVTMHQPPFVYRIENPDGNISYDGYCVDLINELKEMNNFSYEIYDLQHKDSKNKPHTELLIDEIVNKTADIVLAALFAGMGDRNVEYTIPFYDLIGMKMIIKKPTPETSLFRFLTVMEPLVWISILIAYVVTSTLLWIIDKFSPFSYQNNRSEMAEESEKRIFTLKESFWFCVTSLTPQGSGDAPKSVSGRLLAATWWLFGFVFIASYTANLAAFLTVSRIDNKIDSLDSLANQYLVKYTTIKNSTAMRYFKKMADIEDDFFGKWKEMTLGSINEAEKEKYSVWNYPVGNKYTKMWRYMNDIKFLDSLEDGLDKVRRSPNGFVIIADTIEVSNILSTNCDLTTVGEEFSRRPVGLAVSKNSGLKEQLSIGILKMQNARTLEILKEKWWQSNPYQVHCETDEYTEGISLRNIGGIFVVIIAGIGLSWLILLFEFLWKKTASKRLPKNKDPFKVLQRTAIKVNPSENVNNTLRNRTNSNRPNISQDKNYIYTFRSDLGA